MIELRQHKPPCEPAEWPKGTPGTLIVGTLGNDPRKSAGVALAMQAGKDLLGPTRAVSFKRNAEPEEVRETVRQALSEFPVRNVICYGNVACKAIFGVGHNALDVRKGFGFLGNGAVVHLLPDPAHVVRNRVRKAWAIEDLAWSLSHAHKEPSGELIYAHDMSLESLACLEAEAIDIVFDTETFGHFVDPWFRIVTLALSLVGDNRVYVWRDQDMEPGSPLRRVLIRILKKASKSGHNRKHDLLAIQAYLGVTDNAQDPGDDTYIMGRLLRADGAAGLEPLATQIGLVGHKQQADELVNQAALAIGAMRRAREKVVVVEWGTEVRTSPKTGKSQKRKVAIASRPPTIQEADDQALAELRKRREKNPELVDQDKDWLAASRAIDDPMAYAYGVFDPAIRELYCAFDVLATNELLVKYRLELQQEPQIDRIYREVVQLAPRMFAHVEAAGLNVDAEAISSFEVFLDEQAAGLLAEIVQVAVDNGLDQDFNPGSNQQLAVLLFEKLNLPILKETSTGPSCASGVLKLLRADHDVVQKVIDWKEVTKLQSNYARGLREFIRSDGRVHCIYNVCGTESGRASCRDPNMQTLPSRGQYSKRAKSIYRARPGYTYVVLDFKTLEPRVAAVLSEDQDMIQTFRDGVDFHDRTSEIISPVVWGNDYETCGIPLDTPGYEEVLAAERKRRRSIAKVIGLAILYGQGEESMAELAHCTVKEAENSKKAILGRYRTLNRWIQNQIKHAHQFAETWTFWEGLPARRRQIPDIGDDDRVVKSHGERVSYNSPCQGTGHEYCLASGCEIVRWIEDDAYDARVVLLVHDAIYIEVSIQERDEVAARAAKTMTSWWFGDGDNKVPLQVDIETGDTLGSLHKWEPGE